MHRPPCPQAPGIALHLIQRGSGACFSGERDRVAFLDRLRGASLRCECALHAYVLMGNHVHLLLTPSRSNGATRLIDLLVEHALPAWEEGFDATPVYAARYLLGCMRYIELNPVRAGIAARPRDYRWSSHRANALGEEDALVTPHPLYYALGRTAAERQAAYLRMFRGSFSAASRKESRRAGTGS